MGFSNHSPSQKPVGIGRGNRSVSGGGGGIRSPAAEAGRDRDLAESLTASADAELPHLYRISESSNPLKLITMRLNIIHTLPK